MKHLLLLVAMSSLVSCSTLCGGDAFRWHACLNGLWEFAPSMEDSTESLAWRPMRVPAPWGSYWRRQVDGLADTANAKYGFYRVHVNMPAEWEGCRVILQFDCIEEAWSVSVNGRVMEEYPNRMLYAQVDVTEAVEFGKDNEILVKTALPPRPENASWHYGSYQGIGRDVWLMAVPKTHLAYSLIDTSVRNSEICARIKVDGDVPDGMTVAATVLDGAEALLELPECPVDKNGNARLASRWEPPRLWGFGEYGTPELYSMRVELRHNGEVADVKYERFGFREFYTEGDVFMFNGKPFTILGDLITETWDTTDHFTSASAYYQWMRDDNFNFLRFHSSDRLDHEAAFFAADEAGMLVQPEMIQPRILTEKASPMHPQIVKLLENYIIANYNHPSVVSWCLNNESFSVGLANPETVRKINVPLMKEYDQLMTLLKAIDPMRIFEINHNYMLWAYVRQGMFARDNFQVFNIHPYGNLKEVINGEVKALGFTGEVPVLVGEIFAFDNPLDFTYPDALMFCEQRRVGHSMASQIRSALEAEHVAGVICCGLSGNGRVGYTDLHERKLGPWSHLADIRKEDGTPLGVQRGDVFVRWPSLSGPGNKVGLWEFCKEAGGDFGTGLNWFDPAAPIYCPNIVDVCVRDAMREANGDEDMPPLRDTRPAEIVVAAGHGGTPVKGEIVWAASKNHPDVLEGILADGDGTAWFRFPEPDTVRFSAAGQTKDVTIQTLPPRTHEAGYDYLQWVDMGGIDINARKAELREPPAVRKREFLPAKHFSEDDGEAPPLEAGPFPLSENGFIHDFLVLGPFQNNQTAAGWQADFTDYLEALGGEAMVRPKYWDVAETAFSEPFTYLAGTFTIHWRQLHSKTDILDFNSGIMRLVKAGIPDSIAYAAGYLHCIVTSPDERNVRFGLGSDDGYVLWLNGKKLGQFLGGRGTQLNQETYQATLKKGENHIMLKTIQWYGTWSAAISITRPDGTPFDDLKVILPQ